MSWHKTAALVTLVMAPTIAAGTSAMADQITSASRGDGRRGTTFVEQGQNSGRRFAAVHQSTAEPAQIVQITLRWEHASSREAFEIAQCSLCRVRQ